MLPRVFKVLSCKQPNCTVPAKGFLRWDGWLWDNVREVDVRFCWAMLKISLLVLFSGSFCFYLMFCFSFHSRAITEQKQKMKRLGSDLTSAQKEMKAKHKAYENAVGILSRRLQESLAAKESAEAELSKLKAQITDSGNNRISQVCRYLLTLLVQRQSYLVVKYKSWNTILHWSDENIWNIKLDKNMLSVF